MTQWLERVANDLAITAYRLALRDIDQRDLMTLGHIFDRHQAVLEPGTGRYTTIVDHYGHVVRLVEANVAWRILMLNQFHGVVHLGLRSGRLLFWSGCAARQGGFSPPR